jgi:hypothetical protein
MNTETHFAADAETGEVLGEAHLGSASARLPLLCVGDTVEIHGPEIRDKKHQFGWLPEMDKYDGGIATVTQVLKQPDDTDIPAYDLNIDGGEYGWLEIWLTKIDA